MKKGFLLIFFISVVLGFSFFTPVRDYLSKEGFTTLETWIRNQGVLAPLVFGLIYIAATVFALPGSVLTIGGGLLFGAWWGTLVNWLSASIGAMISFLLARYLGREAVTKILKRKGILQGLDDKIGNNGFYSVLLLRLVPLFPFNGLNFGLGLTKVSFRDYTLATLLGMLPGTFVYTSLGSAGRHVSFSDPSTWLQVEVWGPFLLVILLSLVPKIIKRRSGKKVTIYFICTGNSCRSQMAEGYGRRFLGDVAHVFSGGILAHGVNPNAITVMKEDGVDITGQKSKAIDPAILERADVVITLCGDAKESCPAIENKNARMFHWDLPDPEKASGNAEQALKAFRLVRDEIKRRVIHLKKESHDSERHLTP